MKYRRLGNSGLKVSEISLGSWLTPGNAGMDQYSKVIRSAIDMGINYFDTANIYSNGESERMLGQAIAGIDRSHYVISSKVYWPTGEGPNERGLSRKHIMEQCDQSLKRLNVEYIDIYYFHRFDQETPLYESLRAADDLIRQGKVLYLGVSEWNTTQLQEATRIIEECSFSRIITNQVAFNLINRNIELELIPYCEENGIGQVIYSPLAQGVLAGRYHSMQDLPITSRAKLNNNKTLYWYLNQQNLDTLKQLSTLANQIGTTLSKLSLAWVLSKRSVSSALIGVSNVEQLQMNIQASDLQLDEGILRELDQIVQSFKYDGE